MHLPALTHDRRSHYLLVAAGALVLAVAASLAIQPDLMAQLPDFSQVQSTVAAKVKPLVSFIRLGLATVCGVMGIFQCFKASKGSAKDWLPAFLLLIVAGIAITPSTTFDMLGMPWLCQNLTEFGLC